MHSDSSSHHEARRLPARVQVSELVSSRYGSSWDLGGKGCGSHSSGDLSESRGGATQRPLSWDERREGIDVIRTVSGETVKLYSSAMQSPPQPGWVVLITGGSGETGYTWTLYGIPPR